MSEPDPRRLLTGAAGRLGRAWSVDPWLLRAGFVVLCFAGGSGFAFYGAATLLTDPPEERRAVPRAAVIGLAAVILTSVTADVVGGRTNWWVWPILGAGLLAALLGRRVESARRLSDMLRSDSGQRVDAVRLVLGLVLLVAGISALLALRGALGGAGRAVVAAGVLLGGVALLFGPWLWKLTSELAAERRARISADARAEMAAHLHDSVLQTLTLIQRTEDPGVAARLARRQERELRTWLADPDGSRPAGRLVDALQRVVATVEDDTGVTVEVITVGDAELDDRLEALVAATAEALRNAARHSGVDAVALYAEADEAGVEVFVRDRGRGFDPAAVAPDRRGLRESVEGRLRRAGGTAHVRSAPDEGTEVAMSVPREAMT